MAKISFTKLGLKINQEVKTIEYNGQNIEVKQYLPISDKIELISSIVTLSHDGVNNFSNPIQLDVYTSLYILYKYTNITFTDKQREDPVKLYDLVKSSGLLEMIIKTIPEKEYYDVVNKTREVVESIYAYQNSILGILHTIQEDYNGVNLDVNALKEEISNSEDLMLLKEIVTKLG